LDDDGGPSPSALGEAALVVIVAHGASRGRGQRMIDHIRITRWNERVGPKRDHRIVAPVRLRLSERGGLVSGPPAPINSDAALLRIALQCLERQLFPTHLVI
jgi:hypothetical protein